HVDRVLGHQLGGGVEVLVVLVELDADELGAPGVARHVDAPGRIGRHDAGAAALRDVLAPGGTWPPGGPAGVADALRGAGGPRLAGCADAADAERRGGPHGDVGGRRELDVDLAAGADGDGGDDAEVLPVGLGVVDAGEAAGVEGGLAAGGRGAGVGVVGGGE